MSLGQVFDRCQRVVAAFRAISDRWSAVSFSALAFPPFNPPLRPSDTAAGSLPSSTALGLSSSVASATMDAASELMSVGRLRERSGICTPYLSPRGELIYPLTRCCGHTWPHGVGCGGGLRVRATLRADRYRCQAPRPTVSRRGSSGPVLPCHMAGVVCARHVPLPMAKTA